VVDGQRLTRCRTADGRVVDLDVTDGLVVASTPSPARLPGDAEGVDCAGQLVMPALVDAHIHPDKTTWGGPWLSRRAATTLRELMDFDVEVQRTLTRSVADRSEALLRAAAVQGTRAVRAHVDVTHESGLENLHGVVEASRRLRGLIDVQIVAFPQLGLLGAGAMPALMAAAMVEGADVVGGLDPVGVDGDLPGHLDLVFGLAQRHSAPVDVHLHDDGEPGLQQLLAIAERTRSEGMSGQVTVSHAFALATAPPDRRAAVADVLADAGVGVTTCALGGDPVLPLGELRDAGVAVAVGSDGVRDAWTPFGTGSMIDRVHLLAYRLDAMTDDALADCYRAGSDAGADLLGIARAGTVPGEVADLVVVDAESVAQLVVDRPRPHLVLRGGAEVSR
jgi:cytosine/creatinine deaminase